MAISSSAGKSGGRVQPGVVRGGAYKDLTGYKYGQSGPVAPSTPSGEAVQPAPSPAPGPAITPESKAGDIIRAMRASGKTSLVESFQVVQPSGGFKAAGGPALLGTSGSSGQVLAQPEQVLKEGYTAKDILQSMRASGSQGLVQSFTDVYAQRPEMFVEKFVEKPRQYEVVAPADVSGMGFVERIKISKKLKTGEFVPLWTAQGIFLGKETKELPKKEKDVPVIVSMFLASPEFQRKRIKNEK